MPAQNNGTIMKMGKHCIAYQGSVEEMSPLIVYRVSTKISRGRWLYQPNNASQGSHLLNDVKRKSRNPKTRYWIATINIPGPLYNRRHIAKRTLLGFLIPNCRL